MFLFERKYFRYFCLNLIGSVNIFLRKIFVTRFLATVQEWRHNVCILYMTKNLYNAHRQKMFVINDDSDALCILCALCNRQISNRLIQLSSLPVNFPGAFFRVNSPNIPKSKFFKNCKLRLYLLKHEYFIKTTNCFASC